MHKYISGEVRVPKPVLVTLITELIKKQDIKSIHKLLLVDKNAKAIIETQFGGWRGIIIQAYQIFSGREDILDQMVDIKAIFDDYWDEIRELYNEDELRKFELEKAKNQKRFARLENKDLYHYLAMQLYFMVENAAKNWLDDHVRNWKYAKRKGWDLSDAKYLYGSRTRFDNKNWWREKN